MHIVSTWVMVYNLLNLATTYCSIQSSGSISDSNDVELMLEEKNYIPKNGLPILKKPNVHIEGEPKQPPKNALPPKLDSSLTIDNITKRWKDEEARYLSKNIQTCHVDLDDLMPRS